MREPFRWRMSSVFAAHAAVAMAGAEEHEQMKDALRNRDVIGQAKGILMARQDITEGAAFDLLSWASQRLNLRLAQVAEGLPRGSPLPAPAVPELPGASRL